jgi:hypothetical protein
MECLTLPARFIEQYARGDAGVQRLHAAGGNARASGGASKNLADSIPLGADRYGATLL